MTPILILIIVVFVAIKLYNSTRRPKNFPPGPPRYPFVGCLPYINPSHPVQTFFKWSQEFGDIYSVKMGAVDIVVLNDPTMIKKAFKNDHFLNRPDSFAFNYFLNKENIGILTGTGAHWEKHRRFTLRSLRDFGFAKSSTEDIIKREIQEQINRIRSKDGQPLELSWDFNLAITNIIWKLTAGHRFDPDSSTMHKIVRNLQQLALAGGKMAIFDFFPFLIKCLPESVLGIHKIRQQRDVFFRLFSNEIKDHKNAFDSHNDDKDLIDAYLRKIGEEAQHENSDRDFEERNLRRVIGDLFIAGTETTYTSLRWAFLFLIKYPEIQKKIQMEIDKVIGASRQPTLQDRRSMTYLEAFTMETQRFSTIVGLGVPHAAVEDITFCGYFIPKGTQVFSNLFACHMNPKYWGDPQNFRPERFLDENGKVVKPEVYMPFATGRRVCLGESLAKSELFMYLSSLLQTFTFYSTDDPEKIPLEAQQEAFVRVPHKYNMTAKNRTFGQYR